MQQRGDFIDAKVGSILTDLGYTKTRHHDKYKNIQPFWNDEMHRRCLAAIFDFGLKEVSPKVIYPALKECNVGLRPENIKSHLQKYRCNSKANQLEYLHFFERYLRKEKKAALREQMSQKNKQQQSSDSLSSPSSVMQKAEGGSGISPFPLGVSENTDDHHVSFLSNGNPTSPSIPVPSFVSSCDDNSVKPAAGDEEEDQSQSFHFRGDPSMAYQVAIHDDIISKHSIRQQRMGLDGIDNDNRYTPSLDYTSFFATASAIESSNPVTPNAEEIGNPLCFLQDNEN